MSDTPTPPPPPPLSDDEQRLTDYQLGVVERIGPDQFELLLQLLDSAPEVAICMMMLGKSKDKIQKVLDALEGLSNETLALLSEDPIPELAHTTVPSALAGSKDSLRALLRCIEEMNASVDRFNAEKGDDPS